VVAGEAVVGGAVGTVSGTFVVVGWSGPGTGASTVVAGPPVTGGWEFLLGIVVVGRSVVGGEVVGGVVVSVVWVVGGNVVEVVGRVVTVVGGRVVSVVGIVVTVVGTVVTVTGGGGKVVVV
jgi:hypothetical protein